VNYPSFISGIGNGVGLLELETQYRELAPWFSMAFRGLVELETQ
jgi:hypothetical protein